MPAGRPKKGEKGPAKKAQDTFAADLPLNMAALHKAQEVNREKWMMLIWGKLCELSAKGQVDAIKEYLDRTVGKPLPGTLLQAGKFNLPEIHTHTDVINACNAVQGAVLSGKITAHDGEQLCKMINLILTAVNAMMGVTDASGRAQETAEALVRFTELAKERTMQRAPYQKKVRP